MKALKWVLLNGSIAGLVVHGALNDAMWARNLAVFTIWLSLGLAVLAVAVFGWMAAEFDHGKEVPIEDLPAGRSVPRSISLPFDTAMVVFLVAMGWFVSAVAWILGEFLLTLAMLIVRDLREDEKHEKRLMAAIAKALP